MFYVEENLTMTENRKHYESMYDPAHILVKIEKVMDWSLVYRYIKPFYSAEIGRPTIDPLIFVKILLIQYIEGFRSVRFTCKQVQQNITYRWFLGISPYQKVPCHSTISKFLHHRISDAFVWESLFRHVVNLIEQDGYISHDIWIADETELKANANKRKRTVVVLERTLEEDARTLEKVNQKRILHQKKPLPPKTGKVIIKRIIRSLTDPDAGLSVKHDKLGRFAYYDHRIVDGLHNFILDCFVTSATIPGHQVILDRFDQLRRIHHTYAKEVALDAGYYNVRIGEGLEKRKIFAYISYRRYARNEHPKCKTIQFQKVKEDLYACPCGVPFSYKNSTRQGYHEYRPPKGSCEGCPYAKIGDRVLRISVHQDVYERLHSQRLSPRGKVLRSVRPSTVERSFAESKELHGFRYARYRGVRKVTIQVLMTAISQNLKKWARLRSLHESGIDLTYQKKRSMKR